MADTNSQNILANTYSPCSKCGAVLDAVLKEENDDVYMWKTCPEHGTERFLYFKDSTLYKAAERLTPKDKVCERPGCIEGKPCRNHLSRSTTVLLNVTDRCNLACPTCLAASGDVKSGEPTLEQIARAFPGKGTRTKPTVCLIGGEPTLRDDLPEIVTLLHKNGYVPRLNTNGLRLESSGYRKLLRKAGLDWVILQFDGLSESSSLALRGKELAARKVSLVKDLLSDGFRVQLAVMTVAEINGHEVNDILQFAMENGVFWVSFYPHAVIGRASLGTGTTHTADVIRLLEESSGGKITENDFLTAMRLWSFLYRIFHVEPFRQKLSTFPLILVKRDNGYIPLTRLLGLGEKKSFDLRAFFSLLSAFGRAYFYKTSRPDSRILFLSIEKFHDHETLDLREASSCHMCYMTERGTVAFDIYNRFHRFAKNW